LPSATADPPSRTQPALGQNQSAASFEDSGRDIVSLTPGSRVGSYEIVGLVGAGGMGQVYRARDSRLRRDVAIKILPPHFAAGAEHLTRFKREAQTLASLNHPHIAAIYGVEEGPPEASGRAFALALVLELVEGPRSPTASPAARCRSTRRCPSRARSRMRSRRRTSAGSSTAT
jgi:hypothetical protein